MQCACYTYGEHPLSLNPCPEHERWAKAIMRAEREACAAIADDYSKDAKTAPGAAAGVFIASEIRDRSNPSS